MTARPLPIVSSLNAPFFEAAARGRLVLQRCRECKHWIYYPRYACPICLCQKLEWREVTGRGSIYSYSRIFKPQHQYFLDEMPIVLVAVQLEEGPLMISSLTGEDRTLARIDAPVVVAFDSVSPDLSLVKFRLESKPGRAAGTDSARS
jgi:uncharacterized OB-fold protein